MNSQLNPSSFESYDVVLPRRHVTTVDVNGDAAETEQQRRNHLMGNEQAGGGTERRRNALSDWRAANREQLHEYCRNWKAAHPDRVKVHREHEYAQRRRKRRRLRLRREAQRQRRALQRSTIRQTTF